MQDASAAYRREVRAAQRAAEQCSARRALRRVSRSGAARNGLVASLCVALGLALWPVKTLDQPASSQPSPGAEADAFSAELRAIRSEIAARSERERSDSGAQAAVVELSRRIEAIADEIAPLRSRTSVVPATPPARASVPGDTGVGPSSERLYNLEQRQSQLEADRRKVEGQLLARLHDLETRQQRRERDDASALRLLLDRVQQLELARDVVEAHRLDGQNALLARLAALESRLETVPAAPQY